MKKEDVEKIIKMNIGYWISRFNKHKKLNEPRCVEIINFLKKMRLRMYKDLDRLEEKQ